MNKWIAMMLAMLMMLSFVACGDGDNASSGDIGGGTEQTEPTPEPTPAPTPTPEAKDGFGGAHSEQLEEWKSKIVTTINFELPDAMWCPLNKNGTLYLYNTESLDVAHSASPRIQFKTVENLDAINIYLEHFTELEELEPVVIGGVEMSARYYKDVGMYWTEYYGELPNGAWISVQLSKVDMGPGTEAEAILNTVTFG